MLHAHDLPIDKNLGLQCQPDINNSNFRREFTIMDPLPHLAYIRALVYNI